MYLYNVTLPFSYNRYVKPILFMGCPSLCIDQIGTSFPLPSTHHRHIIHGWHPTSYQDRTLRPHLILPTKILQSLFIPTKKFYQLLSSYTYYLSNLWEESDFSTTIIELKDVLCTSLVENEMYCQLCKYAMQLLLLQYISMIYFISY